MGWEIWLCNRSAPKIDNKKWHVRRCDISSENSEKAIGKLINNIPNIDLVMFLADTGTAFGSLDQLSSSGIIDFINAKLVGGLLSCKKLLSKYHFRKKPIKLIWFAGKPAKEKKI